MWRPALGLHWHGTQPTSRPVMWGGSDGSGSPFRGWAIQNFLGSGEKMIEVKRLLDERRTHSCPIAMSCTREDDWCCVSARSESRSESDAIESRHLDITQDDVGWPALDLFPCFLAVMGTANGVSRFRKQFAEKVTQMVVVIDDKD